PGLFPVGLSFSTGRRRRARGRSVGDRQWNRCGTPADRGPRRGSGRTGLGSVRMANSHDDSYRGMDMMTRREPTDDGGADGRERVVIGSPEELIASVPSMLGFPPRPGSVVLVCGRTADGGTGPVVRVDVPGLQPGDALSPTDEEVLGQDCPGGTEGATEPGEGVDHGPARWLARYCA